MKIEDRKSCEYRFSSILINFHQFLSIISIVNVKVDVNLDKTV